MKTATAPLPPLRVGLSRPLAAQKWLAYGQAIYQGADKPRRRHSTAGAHIKAPCLARFGDDGENL